MSSHDRTRAEELRALREDYATIERLARGLPHWTGRMDPLAELTALREIGQVLDRAMSSTARLAVQNGAPIAELARRLGVSRQAAHQRFRDVSRGPTEPSLSDGLDLDAGIEPESD